MREKTVNGRIGVDIREAMDRTSALVDCALSFVELTETSDPSVVIAAIKRLEPNLGAAPRRGREVLELMIAYMRDTVGEGSS